MNKQYVEGVQIGKKLTHWDGHVLYWSLSDPETMSLLLKGQIWSRVVFSDCHVTRYGVPNEHANSLREIIIHSILN